MLTVENRLGHFYLRTKKEQQWGTTNSAIIISRHKPKTYRTVPEHAFKSGPNDRILRFFLCPEIEQFFPHFGAISEIMGERQGTAEKSVRAIQQHPCVCVIFRSWLRSILWELIWISKSQTLSLRHASSELLFSESYVATFALSAVWTSFLTKSRATTNEQLHCNVEKAAPPHPLPSPPHLPPPTWLRPQTPSPRNTNRNSHPFAKTTPGKNYPVASARKNQV